MQRKTLLLLSLLVFAPWISAQTGFIGSWEQRASATQARQPAWPPPLITVYVGLIQVARTDFIRQTASNLVQTWSLDGSKGLNLIPFADTEVDVNLPAYSLHNLPTVTNGAGDMSFLLKYRPFAGSAAHGNYVLSAFIASTIPTGSYKNGSPDATVSPNLGFGKGFGPFDVQTTLGASLPVEDTATLGRAIAWNTAGQLHLARYFWPEIELNSTWFSGGPNDGKKQTFATPGLLLSIKRRHGETDRRLGLCVGGGMQIATSSFHTYNHGIAITTRLLF